MYTAIYISALREADTQCVEEPETWSYLIKTYILALAILCILFVVEGQHTTK